MNSDAIQHIINTIAPIFIMIGLGAVLKSTNFITDDLAKGLNKLVFWVGLPTLLFYKIASANKSFSDVLNLYYVLLVGVAVAIVASLICCFILKLDRPLIAAFMQGAFRGNLVFIGLPLAVFCFAGEGVNKVAEIEELTVLTLSLIVPTYNILGVFFLILYTDKIDISFPGRLAKRLITNPLIVAVLCGILYAHFFKTMPIAFERSCKIIGQMTLPLAILTIGANIVTSRGASNYNVAFLSSLIKVVLCPVAGFFVMKHFIKLDTDQQILAMLFLACPTAVSSYVLTEQLGGNKHLAAAIIVISSILAAFSIAGVLYVMR